MPQLPGFPPTCPYADCPVGPWVTMAAVVMYTLLACVALLAISLINTLRRRHHRAEAALTLLAVAVCALVAIVGDRWLLLHNPPFFWGGHYTPARAILIRQAEADALKAAAGHFYAASVALVIGVSVTAAHLIHAAHRSTARSTERMS